MHRYATIPGEMKVLSTWNDLSPKENDFSSITRFKLSLTPKQLLRHCKVYFK